MFTPFRLSYSELPSRSYLTSLFCSHNGQRLNGLEGEFNFSINVLLGETGFIRDLAAVYVLRPPESTSWSWLRNCVIAESSVTERILPWTFWWQLSHKVWRLLSWCPPPRDFGITWCACRTVELFFVLLLPQFWHVYSSRLYTFFRRVSQSGGYPSDIYPLTEILFVNSSTYWSKYAHWAVLYPISLCISFFDI